MNTKDNKRHQETMQRAYAAFAKCGKMVARFWQNGGAKLAEE